MELLKTSHELKQGNWLPSYFPFKHNNVKVNVSHSISYFLINALTVTYSFVIIIIICCLENEWIMSKSGNIPNTILSIQHTSHIFLIWHVWACAQVIACMSRPVFIAWDYQVPLNVKQPFSKKALKIMNSAPFNP